MTLSRHTIRVGIMAAALACGSTGPQAQELLFHTPEDVLSLPGETAADGLTRRVLAAGDDVVVVRASLPPGADIPAHAHPAGKAALVTVLSGGIAFGLGDAFDASRLQEVPAGGLVVFRADDPMHFARSGPAGAEILVVAVAPEVVEDAVLQAAAAHGTDGERVEHMTVEPPEDLADAAAMLRDNLDVAETAYKAGDLSAIHEASYHLEAAVERMEAEETLRGDALSRLKGTVEGVHHASEDNDPARLATHMEELRAQAQTVLDSLPAQN